MMRSRTAPAGRAETGARREHVLDHAGVGAGILAAIGAALDECAIAGAPYIIAAVDDDLAARQDSFRISLHLETFVGVVVDIHVMGLAVEDADRLLAGGIENDDVGIAADRNRAFLRKQPKNLRRPGRSQLDKAIERNMALGNAVVIDQAHAVLDAWAAIRNFAEIVLAELLLLLEAEGA